MGTVPTEAPAKARGAGFSGIFVGAQLVWQVIFFFFYQTSAALAAPVVCAPLSYVCAAIV